MADDIILIPGDTTIVVTEVVQTLVVPTPDSLVVVEPNSDLILVDAPSVLVLQSDGGSGPAGPPGPPGPPGPGAFQNLFIQDAAPADPGYNYVWLQTDIGGNPANFSLWFEGGH